jgi:hypothetical protein
MYRKKSTQKCETKEGGTVKVKTEMKSFTSCPSKATRLDVLVSPFLHSPDKEHFAPDAMRKAMPASRL